MTTVREPTSYESGVGGLPRGTVTFLFTDIEGSTKLLTRLRERYAEALSQHRSILGAAAAANAGHEIDSKGDSCFFAFARANDAVAAAVAAQRALAEHPWPEGGAVRVRMGLHTGEPAVDDRSYVGLGVHRAARIGAAAHGGQILLSSATRELTEEIDGVSVRELGLYRLKDIDRPERLFQIDIEGLQTAFPPLSADSVAEPSRLRRRTVRAAALACAIGAAISISVLALSATGGERVRAAGDSVGVVDPSGRLVADIGVGATPTHLAVGEGAYWVTNADGDTVSRIDAKRRAVVQTIRVGSSPSGITTGDGAVWVANSLDGTVSRIDPVTNAVVQTIAVGNGPVGIAAAAGSIWVANTGDGTIARIDALSGEVMETLPIAATELAVGAGSLWASERAANQVVRIDPLERQPVATIAVGNGPEGMAVGEDTVWVANSLDGTVSRIALQTSSVTSTIPVGNGPTDIAAGAHAVWVSNQFDGTLARIDPRTNEVALIRVGNQPRGLAVSGANLLVSVDARSREGHRGGTLRMRLTDAPDSIDTAIASTTTSSPLLRMTNDGLVAFNQVSGLAGTQIVPDLAVSLPAPSDGGRTYSFQLRPGIRYSNGRPIKASDVRFTLERDFALGTPVAYYNGIVGAARCEKDPERCDLSRGIVADNRARTVTFHLVSPDPDFLEKLALSFAYVLPASTPLHPVGTHPLPATGPYRIASYQPKQRIRFVRNPYFHEWSQAAQPDGYPDEIVADIGGTADGAVGDVIHGRADLVSSWESGTPSSGRLQTLTTRYASQVRSNPAAATWALFLNTRIPPFDRLDVRRALNLAADRNAAVEAAGGPEQAQPTCQILPPNFPGYRPYCPYTAGSTDQGRWVAPDLARARALVARSGTRGMKVTVWSWSSVDGIGPYAVDLLGSLGYRATMKVRGDDYFNAVLDSRTGAQAGFFGWYADYPAASDFFRPNFSCASFLRNSPANGNAAQFCDPSIDRQMKQALAMQATDPQAARRLWEGVDRQTVDLAPWLPLVNPKIVDVLSRRVHNYQYSPANGVLIDQLRLR